MLGISCGDCLDFGSLFPKWIVPLGNNWPRSGASTPILPWSQWCGIPLRLSVVDCIKGQICRDLKADLIKGEAEASRLEQQYALTKNLQVYGRLQATTRKVLLIRTSLTRKKLLQQVQTFFEQGEQTSRLLAWLVHEQSPAMSVPRIVASSSMVHMESVAILFFHFSL